MRFAIVTRDELWEGGVLREERVSWGEAITRGDEVVASDALDEELMRSIEPLIRSSATFSPLSRGEGLRRVISARRVDEQVLVEEIIVLRCGDLSVVTTPQHFAEDLHFLRSIPAEMEPAIDYREVPILWRNSSGAVLLHEAAGHPAEHGKDPVAWPAWLSVTDEPQFGRDDTGAPTRAVNLLRGERPSAKRRATFTDVPLPRLSNVVVRQNGAPFYLPERQLDIFLIGGGMFDPLTDLVTIHVTVGALVERGTLRRVEPFTITETRAAVARSLRAAEGETMRYPGVICSSEGQEIVVGSHAPPLLLTHFDA